MGIVSRNISVIPEELDRATLVTYFLGGVVPLVALGVVLERTSLTSFSDKYEFLELVGTVVSIAMFSLYSFLILRRIVRRSLKEVKGNNSRLESLLNASRSLASAHDGNGASQSAVYSALALTQARVACVFLRSKGDDSLKMTAASGANGAQLYETLIEPLIDLVDLVMREGRPAIRSREDGEGALGESAIQSAVVVPLPGEKSPLGALVVIHTDPGKRFDASQADAIATLAGLASVAMINAELRFAQRNFFSHVTDILVTAIDLHLDYHQGHGRRVAHLANRVGRRLELDEKQLEHLHFAALLHDIGMLKIDRSVTHSSKTCEKHPRYGYRMLSGIRLWNEVAPLILHHHERFDGEGHPEGLAGEAIPIESRIIALCEAFDSMTALTSYQAPMPIDAAVHIIEASAGTQFDPVVVRAFLDILRDGTVGDEEFPSRERVPSPGM